MYVYFVVVISLFFIFIVVQIEQFVSQQILIEVFYGSFVAALVDVGKEGCSVVVILVFYFEWLC